MTYLYQIGLLRGQLREARCDARDAKKALAEAEVKLARARSMIESMNDEESQEAFKEAWHEQDQANAVDEVLYRSGQTSAPPRNSRVETGLTTVQALLRHRYGSLDSLLP